MNTIIERSRTTGKTESIMVYYYHKIMKEIFARKIKKRNELKIIISGFLIRGKI